MVSDDEYTDTETFSVFTQNLNDAPSTESLSFDINEDTHFAIIPTATPFARNSIFSGLMPAEVKSKYPELWLLTDEIKPDIVSEIVNETQDNNYGWSPDACFLLKQGMKNGEKVMIEQFQNENETLKLWYRIFGKKGKFGSSDKDYPDDIVFMERIK